MGTIDITNLTEAGVEAVLRIGAGEDLELPAGLSNADLDAISEVMTRVHGNDPDRVGRWLNDYRRANRGR